jgi:energy-coupling factor transporter ATP-binding protein EcfA2
MLNLKSLTFEALRGATQQFELKFDSGKKIVIVFGENGSGKSTICDALDLIGNDGLSSLDGKGLSSTAKYWNSTNRNSAETNVTLAATNGTWSARLVKGKCSVVPADTRPKVKILRRHQILNLIAARPGDRYQSLQPFLAIESLDDSERSLRDLINSTKARLKEAAARIGENLQTLENVWKQAGSPGSDMMSWAAGEAKRKSVDLDAIISIIQNYQQLRQSLASRIIDLRDATEREAEAQATLSKTESELAEALAGAEVDGEELTQLLQAARQYFHKHGQFEACPLCQSREFVSTLSETVESKLKAMATVRTALKDKASAQRALDSTVSQLETTSISAKAAAEQLRTQCENWHPDLPTTTAVSQIRPLSDSSWSEAELKRLSDAAESLLALLVPELAGRTQLKILLQTVRDALEQYQHNSQQKAELDLLLPRIEKAHEIFVDERRFFVDEILSRIATRVGELYEEIHPGEGLNKISLQLDPAKRASLEVVSEFPGATDAPPGAYMSESHLDTLGISIFLALAELDAPQDTVLVLDDVVASVDEPHVDRIIETLYKVSQSFARCVLTTHYLPWREKFRWGYLKNGECQFLELGAWSYENGIVMSKHTPRIELLQSHLAKALPEPSEVCGSAGVILEAILDFLTLKYECPIPRRRTKPTLGDLLPAINKKLRAALRVELHDLPQAPGVNAPIVELGVILTKIEKVGQLRNIMGAHFNDLAFHLNGKDGIEFGRLVLDLADALIHPNHGWPGSDKSGEYWTNSGKSRRLYPLKQPS